MRILCFSSLFPNHEQPSHGVFVENRLRHLVASGQVEARVVAPIPWFPFSKGFGEWSAYARAPFFEIRHGLPVWHPRYVTIPKIGMNWAPGLMAAGVRETMRAMAKEWDFDIIDAHYFYPDGVAAAQIAQELGKPLVITARGTDLNLIPQYAKPRQMIVETANQAEGLVTVCQALKDALFELGIADERVTVLRNGVDLTLFSPKDRQAARDHWGVGGPTLLSVGQLIERKGHHLIIEALVGLPHVSLLIAGDGPERERLNRVAESCGVASRVRFLGRVNHADLPGLYSAADLLVLASSREGWANVLLEAMACGTPVAATDVWGTSEVVTRPEAGVLIPKRETDAIAHAIRTILAAPPHRAATRRYAEAYSWEETTAGQLALFKSIQANWSQRE
jgi:glycosyltransferase involved in cell wall biosynthesis